MAVTSRLVKPAVQELVHLTVLRSERLSAHWMRITLGGGEIERFAPMTAPRRDGERARCLRRGLSPQGHRATVTLRCV